MLGEAEHDGSGRKLRAQYYLWLDSLPLATIDADYDAQGKVGNPTLLYLHGDHLDTPRLATDASGQIAWQWQSDAFGRGEALSQGSTRSTCASRAVLRCGERAALQLLPRL